LIEIQTSKHPTQKAPLTKQLRILSRKTNIMNCQDLAKQIQELQPEASTQDVARLCLLLSNFPDKFREYEQQEKLKSAWQEVGLKLQAATDQHAAMTQELEELANSDPEKFTRDQIWILIRAIKVQSQVLQMYVGHPILDV
jgi:hypothetical protein